MTKTVLQLLQENRQTVASLQHHEDAMADSSDADRPLDTILEEILSKPEWKGKRASKMDLDDFLQLLAEFNRAGIHFS